MTWPPEIVEEKLGGVLYWDRHGNLLRAVVPDIRLSDAVARECGPCRRKSMPARIVRDRLFAGRWWALEYRCCGVCGARWTVLVVE